MRRKLTTAAVLGGLAVISVPASAQVFDDGVPAGYTCTGNCGTSGANGDVTLAPGGGSAFGWISTDGATTQNPLSISGTTNGTTLTSSAFTATAGQALSFGFNYITSDGAGYSDYAFVRLLGGADPIILFTARTNEEAGGNTVPGFGLPGISEGVTLKPASTPIKPGSGSEDGGPLFSPLGSSSGGCYDVGCGFTGWIFAQYLIPTAGEYQLQFGVFNFSDSNYDSALAFDFATGVGGVPQVPTDPSVVPEPGTVLLTASGLLALVGVSRRRRTVS